MAYEKLILLAPCHGLEDFPLYHTGEEAASLLACWTALWHPLFIHSAAHLPGIERCDYPTDEIDNALLLLPTPCEVELDADLPETAKLKNAVLIRGEHSRSKILKAALARYGDEADKLDAELVRDFLAFGFAFLQVEVLTQQMRYSSSIDQTRIARDLKLAAAALIAGDSETCREKLTVCHDALTDERSHYYPVEVYFVDLTLLATQEATLGRSLDRQLDDEPAQNFIASGVAIERLAQHNPSALDKLRNRLAAGEVGLAGGEYEELRLPLCSPGTAAEQLRKGQVVYQEHLGQLPSTFARRANGMYPNLAYLLRDAGFESALHLKFDEGQMPDSAQGKTTWQVGDADLIECYARAPLDAAAHETFLNLPSQLSDTMDTDHVATKMFVHWPGHVAPWYHDLRRCARYGTALGKFVTLTEYFSEAAAYATKDSFHADDYVYPYLQQSAASGQGGAIANCRDYWQREIECVAKSGLTAIANILDCDDTEQKTDIAQVIQEKLCQTEDGATTVVNPFSFPRRVLLTSTTGQLASGDAVYAAAPNSDGSQQALVDVPAMGFATVRFDGQGEVASGPEIVDAEELMLRNEFFQATIDPVTGTLRSLRDYKSRKTRLSQQLAFRITLPKTGQPWVDSKSPVAYSVMAADSVEVTRNGQLIGEIVSRGRLLALNGEVVGEFVQRYQVERGNRILAVEFEVRTVEEVLLDDPWDSYYACRFAFADESAVLRAGCRYQAHDVSRRRLAAPLFVDIDCGNLQTTLLTGGLPFHRRASDTIVETLIATSGDSAIAARFGIGVDLPNASRSAIDFLAKSQSLELSAELAGAASSEVGWFFHIDSRNVIVTDWRPLEDGTGIRLQIVETAERSSTVSIRSFKPWRTAALVNFRDETVAELSVYDGVAEYPIPPGAFAEIRLQW